MRNLVLAVSIFAMLFAGSCVKNTNPPLAYLVDTVANVYLNNNDTLRVPLEVRFLTGNSNEAVTLSISNLPPSVYVVSDSFVAKPTYTANFVFYAKNAVVGNYPVTLTAYSPSTGKKYYTFNLAVVHYNCADFLAGTYTGRNTCKATNYTYTSKAIASGDTALSINNFGGYGTNVNALLRLNCNNDSVTIYRHNAGNGVTITGQGHFTSSQIFVSYVALNVPGGYNDTCTAILTRP